MGLLAVYMKVNEEQLKKLKETPTNELLDAIEDLEEQGTCETVDLDKMWDGLHFVLTGVSATRPITNHALSEMVVGAQVFSDEEDAPFISYSTADQAAVITLEAQKVKWSDLIEKFDPKVLDQNEVYPNIWVTADKKLLSDQLTLAFEELIQFYQRLGNNHVVVSIY